MKIPEKVLEFIDSPIENIVKKEFSFKKSEDIDDVVRNVIEIIMPQIDEFYTKFDFEHRLPTIYKILVEPMKNGNFYSNNTNNPLNVELFMYENGLVASFCDGGKYFQRSEIKNHWESRKKHPEKFTPSIEGLGKGCGTRFAYDFMDLIFVDNQSNKLYTGVTTENRNFFLK